MNDKSLKIINLALKTTAVLLLSVLFITYFGACIKKKPEEAFTIKRLNGDSHVMFVGEEDRFFAYVGDKMVSANFYLEDEDLNDSKTESKNAIFDKEKLSLFIKDSAENKAIINLCAEFENKTTRYTIEVNYKDASYVGIKLLQGADVIDGEYFVHVGTPVQFEIETDSVGYEKALVLEKGSEYVDINQQEFTITPKEKSENNKIIVSAKVGDFESNTKIEISILADLEELPSSYIIDLDSYIKTDNINTTVYDNSGDIVKSKITYNVLEGVNNLIANGDTVKRLADGNTKIKINIDIDGKIYKKIVELYSVVFATGFDFSKDIQNSLIKGANFSFGSKGDDINFYASAVGNNNFSSDNVSKKYTIYVEYIGSDNITKKIDKDAFNVDTNILKIKDEQFAIQTDKEEKANIVLVSVSGTNNDIVQESNTKLSVLVNKGVNAKNHYNLKSALEDTSIEYVNILNDIKIKTLGDTDGSSRKDELSTNANKTVIEQAYKNLSIVANGNKKLNGNGYVYDYSAVRHLKYGELNFTEGQVIEGTLFADGTTINNVMGSNGVSNNALINFVGNSKYDVASNTGDIGNQVVTVNDISFIGNVGYYDTNSKINNLPIGVEDLDRRGFQGSFGTFIYVSNYKDATLNNVRMERGNWATQIKDVYNANLKKIYANDNYATHLNFIRTIANIEGGNLLLSGGLTYIYDMVNNDNVLGSGNNQKINFSNTEIDNGHSNTGYFDAVSAGVNLFQLWPAFVGVFVNLALIQHNVSVIGDEVSTKIKEIQESLAKNLFRTVSDGNGANIEQLNMVSLAAIKVEPSWVDTDSTESKIENFAPKNLFDLIYEMYENKTTNIPNTSYQYVVFAVNLNDVEILPGVSIGAAGYPYNVKMTFKNFLYKN